ncbi:hypothetical protein AB0L70_34995 [Kribbella sp. NPDC051952]|uniref:hypothetical protein n=1 Tax=Kribbella sp. NPDC051952 TaxID=3154851 RepID=UPI003441F92B
MASLASFTTVFVTAVQVNGMDDDPRGITAVRWDSGDRWPEESSVADFVRWLDRGGARAYVLDADGGRGARIRVHHDGRLRHLRTAEGDPALDALLTLPRWQGHGARKKHMSRG